MAVSLLAVSFIFSMVSSKTMISNNVVPSTTISTTLNTIITNITLNVSINNSQISDSVDQNVSLIDVEDIISESWQAYLDKLLINTHIGHKLDFDLIEETSKHQLIVHFHVILIRNTITDTNNNNQGINIDDLQSIIQWNSDQKYGKNVIVIKVNNNSEQTLNISNPLTTNINYTHSMIDHMHHEHIAILILFISLIVALFTCCIGCIGCIIIIYYVKRIRNEQKQKLNSNSSISDNIRICNNDIINNSDEKAIDIVIANVIANVEGNEECDILVNNNKYIGEDSHCMSDSEALYRNIHNIIIPGSVIDDNTTGSNCITTYGTNKTVGNR